VTADNQTSLSFSLKESVWFQKGQEVAELLSISLDPDIAIQERDYEVVVRGKLHLAGEYIVQQGEEAAFSLRELSPVRTVDSVYTREDGINELSHSFPLEISIPRSRVKQIDDLYVTIESFDYEMPEEGCLQLIADIAIWGLCEQGGAREEIEDTEQYEDTEEHYNVPVFLPEEKREEEKVRKEIEDTEQYEDAEEHYNMPVFLQEEKREEEKVRKEIEDTEQYEDAEEYYDVPIFLQEEKREEDIFEPFQLEVRKLPKEKQEQPPEKEEFSPQIELFGRAKAVLEEQDADEEFEYSHRDENALYLTKLFTKERDEEFTKMRMYFVQQGDTVDSIAERYDITVQQLTRINDLDELYVQEGKILYIPVTKPRTKS
jgi:stage VI sporulation protein D